MINNATWALRPENEISKVRYIDTGQPLEISQPAIYWISTVDKWSDTFLCQYVIVGKKCQEVSDNIRRVNTYDNQNNKTDKKFSIFNTEKLPRALGVLGISIRKSEIPKLGISEFKNLLSNQAF